MWMLHRGPRRLAVILEDQDVLEAAIPLEVGDAIAEGPEHVFNALIRHVGKCVPVVRRLDNHFMRANSVHAVVHAVGATVEISFDSQSGILVRHHADCPTRLVAPAGPIAVGENLRWRLAFVSGTKWAESPLEYYAVPGEISWPACSIGGDNDPASGDGVLP